MKTHIPTPVTLILLLTAASTALAAPFPDATRQALRAAAADVQASLAAADLPAGETISLLPLGGDNEGYLEGLLKNAVTSAGLPYVEGKQDPFWDEVMREVEWDERKADMLDPHTLTVFGKLKSTQLLLYGNVIIESSQDRVYVEIQLHLSSIATKQHLWGGVFAHRFYKPENMEGLVSLDPAAREILKQAVSSAATSIGESQKLADVKTVALIPIAGDIDRYVTSLVTDTLSSTQLMPRQLDLRTLGQARHLLQDKPDQADALLVGAVRDLSRTLIEDLPLKQTWRLHAEVQLAIQDASTRDILWSQTLTANKDVITESSEEAVAWAFVRENPLLGLIAGIVIALGFAGRRFLKATTRVR